MKREPTYVGIDVAKDRVDIAVRPTGQSWSASYEEKEVEILVARLQVLEPAGVILEATGGLELTLVAALAAASLPVAVVNPRQVRDFAKSTGQLAKNDRLDAQVLAHFGEAIQPPMRALRDADTRVFGAMVARRRQVVAMVVARTSLSIDLHDVEEHTCSNIREFNHRYLNDKGISALLTLLAFDAAGLDLAAIDVLRGGEALSAAYGPRKTRRDKKLGKEMQSWLKGLKSVDEPATMEAADRYVEYRYLDHGSLPNYKKRKELEGDTPSERYYREWFRAFNEALGFWQPGPGRPSNTPDHH